MGFGVGAKAHSKNMITDSVMCTAQSAVGPKRGNVVFLRYSCKRSKQFICFQIQPLSLVLMQLISKTSTEPIFTSIQVHITLFRVMKCSFLSYRAYIPFVNRRQG